MTQETLLRAACSLGLLAGVAAIAAGEPATVHACTINPNYNPLVESDVVASGYIAGFEVAPSDDPAETRHPVLFGFRVDRVFAGDVPRFVAFLSNDPTWDDTLGGFGPSLCVGLGGWSVGRYVLLTFNYLDDGALAVGIPLYVGDAPSDAGFLQVVENIEHPFLPTGEPPAPPDVGTGLRAEGQSVGLDFTGVLLTLVGFVGVLYLRRRPTAG